MFAVTIMGIGNAIIIIVLVVKVSTFMQMRLI